MMKPFCSTAGIHTPISVPMMLATPPKRLVPPRATAVIACRLSVEWPATEVVEKYATARKPPSPLASPPRV